ncbi:hypothetical protein ACN9MB_13350 [Dyella kyungheensis]|uniref:hypothetical protein n=1 Tax=Dyella kyungheensis TaxID=1242174 RepID=UPI003CF56500
MSTYNGCTRDDHEDALCTAVSVYNGKWPDELTSGVLFYYGQRITRSEFETYAKDFGYVK